MSRRRRRNDLTLADKVEVINLVHQNTSQTDVARIFDCSQSQISRIISKRDEIVEEWEMSEKSDRKRRRSTREETREKHGEARHQAASSLSSAQRKEGKDTDQHQESDSASANGWSLFYWKDNVSPNQQVEMDSDTSQWYKHFTSPGGRRGRGRPRASANTESRISNQLLDVLKSYDLCDVYCADEFALFYAALPDRMHRKGEEGADSERKTGNGGEEKNSQPDKQQVHVTVFLACNVTGSDKREPLIIEDSDSGCFHGANEEPVKSGCLWAKAPNAWMTTDIFKEYLLALDYDMRRQKRYVLLLVDNIPPHDPEAGRTLEHVRVLYIRSYATPFFHGIFYSVRSHYRKQVLLRLVNSGHDSTGSSSSRTKSPRSSRGERQKELSAQSVDITFPDALRMLQLAWHSVSPQDIVPCFSKAGICAPYIHGLQEPNIVELPELPNGFISPEQLEDFVNFDTDIECSGPADLLSAECRILSDMRQQGYTDIGIDRNNDTMLEIPHTPVVIKPEMGSSGISSAMLSPELPCNRASAELVREEQVSNAQAMGALGVLRSFLQQQGLGVHNLCALEAQVYACIRQ